MEHGLSCCDTPTIQESELQKAVVQAINKALGGKEEMLVALEENIAMVFALEDENSIESIDAKLKKLQQELLKRANVGVDYEDLVNEIEHMREQKQNVMLESAGREGLKQRIVELKQFLAEQTDTIEEYDETLVRRMVEKIVVCDNWFEVVFKSGAKVTVEK